MNSGPLEEQAMLLIAEPSLQPRPPHPLAITGELCVNYYPGLSSPAEVLLMTGLGQFISGQATTQSHQVRASCHTHPRHTRT